MAMSYTSLIADKSAAGSIRRWVNYAQLDVEQILEEAQALIYQTLRLREMRTEFPEITLAPGAATAPLPDRFLDPISMHDKTHNLRIDLTSEGNIADRRIYEDGALIRSYPQFYGLFSNALQFDCACEEETKLAFVGFQRPEYLSVDRKTNFLTERYPNLLRVACVTQAYDFMSNTAKYQSNLSLLSGLIEAVAARDDLSLRGGVFETRIE